MPTPESRITATEAPAMNGWILGSIRFSLSIRLFAWRGSYGLRDGTHVTCVTLCCTCCVFQTILLPYGRSAAPCPGAVRAEHRLSYSFPEHHHRPRLGAGVLPHPL